MVRASSIVLVLLAGCAEDAPDCEACQPRPPSTLFVADRGTQAILRYDGVTGQFEDVFAAGQAQRIDRPAGVRLGPSGHIYLAGFGRGDVVRYDVASGAMRGVFYWDTTLLEEPMDLVFRGDELLVLGNDTRNVVVLDATGTAVRDFGFPQMSGATDLTLGPDQDTLYVATISHPELGTGVQAWDVASGQLVHHFGDYTDLAMASTLALRDDGTLYVADWERGQVVRFDPRTGARLQVVVEAASGLLSAPVSLDFGPDGALYVLDALGVHRLDPDTGVELSLLVDVGDGHNQRPRSFTFLTDTAIAQAIARTR